MTVRLRPDQLGHRITSAEPRGATSVLVAFADGQKRLWDLRDMGGAPGVFGGLLRDPGLFARVGIAPGGEGLAWPNGADVDADVMYHAGQAVRVLSTDYDPGDDSLFVSF